MYNVFVKIYSQTRFRLFIHTVPCLSGILYFFRFDQLQAICRITLQLFQKTLAFFQNLKYNLPNSIQRRTPPSSPIPNESRRNSGF